MLSVLSRPYCGARTGPAGAGGEGLPVQVLLLLAPDKARKFLALILMAFQELSKVQNVKPLKRVDQKAV